MRRIYDCIKKAIESTQGYLFETDEGEQDHYSVTFQTLDDTVPESLGIFLYESANDTETITGLTVAEQLKFHIQIITAPTEESAFRAVTFLRNVCDTLEAIKGEQAEGFRVLRIHHLGNRALLIGANETGQIAVANYNIIFKLN